MTSLDVVLLVLLALFAARGWWRGLVREGFGLAGILGGGLAATLGWRPIAEEIVRRQLTSPLVAGLVAGVAVFLTVYLAAQIAGVLVDRMARALFLGPINHAAGACFGVAKGAAVLGVLLTLATHIVHSTALQDEIARSTVGGPLVRLAALVMDAGHAAVAPVAARQPI